MAHEVESLFSARVTPWHRIGTVTPDVLTAKEAIIAAGLNWRVEKEPVFGQRLIHNEDGMGYLTYSVPNRFNLVRDSDHRVMSVVSDVYKPFQNEDAFGFMDTVVDDDRAKYETAGSLRHGNVIFVTMHVPLDVQIGGEDKHEAYLLLRTTHDGSGRISLYVVMVRVVCMNTLTWAIGGASHQWGVTHTADVKGKVSEARDALGLTFKYSEAFQKEMDALLNVPVNDDQAVTLLETVLEDRPSREDEIDAIIANWRASDNIDNFRETGYGFLNGVTEYMEHVKDNRSGEALFTRLLDGKDAKLRTNLKTRLLARA